MDAILILLPVEEVGKQELAHWLTWWRGEGTSEGHSGRAYFYSSHSLLCAKASVLRGASSGSTKASKRRCPERWTSPPVPARTTPKWAGQRGDWVANLHGAWSSVRLYRLSGWGCRGYEWPARIPPAAASRGVGQIVTSAVNECHQPSREHDGDTRRAGVPRSRGNVTLKPMLKGSHMHQSEWCDCCWGYYMPQEPLKSFSGTTDCRLKVCLKQFTKFLKTYLNNKVIVQMLTITVINVIIA